MAKRIYKKHHYQNISLTNIKGERWEDIPGLDGYFCISNFGRVKRLEFETQYRDGRICIRKPRIIKPTVLKKVVKDGKFHNEFLTNRVSVAGRRYGFTVARLVYYCFVEEFDLDDHKLVVICKDTDNFNIRPRNLQLVDLSQKQIRVIERGRFTNNLENLSPQQKTRQRESITKKRRKQVSQYSRKGKKIRTYPSLQEPQNVTGIHAQSIGLVASGKLVTAGGYFWRLGNSYKIDVTAAIQQRKQASLLRNGRKLTQFDMNGQVIAHYFSIKSAAVAAGVSSSSIYQALLGRYKSTKGYYWKDGHILHNIDLSRHLWGKASMAKMQSKSVRQLTLDGQLVAVFQSVKSAAESMNVNSGTMSGALNGSQKTLKAYRWEFAKK